MDLLLEEIRLLDSDDDAERALEAKKRQQQDVRHDSATLVQRMQETFDREKADLERRLAAAAADEAERKKLEAEIKISGSHIDRFADGERERCSAQRRGVDAQQQVMHDGVADQHDVVDVHPDVVGQEVGVEVVTEVLDEGVERVADG